MQLQRLPGLTERDQEPGTRAFIDEDMLAALQGSALARFILGDMRGLGSRAWLSVLSKKSITMASYILKDSAAGLATVVATIFRNTPSVTESRSGYDRQIAADTVMIAMEMEREEERIDLGGLLLEGISLGSIDLDGMIIDNFHIRNSSIEEVLVGPYGISSKIEIHGCLISRVLGVSSERGLPTMIFQKCEVSEFEEMQTNSSVLKSSMPPQIKALITVLRKLYIQPGSGRRINAFKKGLPSGPVLESIDKVVQILIAEGILTIWNGVAHPVRKQTARIQKILNELILSQDDIVLKTRGIAI